MFGKPYADYFRFQKLVLVAVAVVGLARLALSTAGVSNSEVKYVSMTVVGFAGLLYYGLRVGRSGFGSYRHLLPLVFNQTVLGNCISILGIGLSAMGTTNIYDAPEFRGPGGGATTSPLTHALAHLFIGNIAGTFVGWGVGSLVMLVGGRPAKK